MSTIKAMVIDILDRSGRCSTDECIRELIRQKLDKICSRLPKEPNADTINAENKIASNEENGKQNDPNSNRKSDEFLKEMFKCTGPNLHEEAVQSLVERVMNERDDLVLYPILRKELIINLNSNAGR